MPNKLPLHPKKFSIFDSVIPLCSSAYPKKRSQWKNIYINKSIYFGVIDNKKIVNSISRGMVKQTMEYSFQEIFLMLKYHLREEGAIRLWRHAKWGGKTWMQIVRYFLLSVPRAYTLSEAKGWGKYRTVEIKAEKVVEIEVSIF